MLLLLLTLPAPALAHDHGQIYVGANLIIATGSKVHLGLSASVAGAWTFAEVPIDRSFTVVAPVVGPWAELGWIAGEGRFEAVGASFGAAYPLTGSPGDCVGYIPAVEADGVLGYRWTKAENGLEGGGRARFMGLGAVDVVGAPRGLTLSAGAAADLLPECFLL